MMSGIGKVGTLLALPRAAFAFLGVTAVILGILTMHIWMGGHGPATHGAQPANGHAATGAPHTEESGHTTQTASLHAATPAGSTDAAAWDQGCVGSCGDDGAALGLCVLALIVVTILTFLLPAGRIVPGTVLLRGPPRLRLQPLAIPYPSLIRLCISRT